MFASRTFKFLHLLAILIAHSPLFHVSADRKNGSILNSEKIFICPSGSAKIYLAEDSNIENEAIIENFEKGAIIHDFEITDAEMYKSFDDRNLEEIKLIARSNIRADYIDNKNFIEKFYLPVVENEGIHVVVKTKKAPETSRKINEKLDISQDFLHGLLSKNIFHNKKNNYALFNDFINVETNSSEPFTTSYFHRKFSNLETNLDKYSRISRLFLDFSSENTKINELVSSIAKVNSIVNATSINRFEIIIKKQENGIDQKFISIKAQAFSYTTHNKNSKIRIPSITNLNLQKIVGMIVPNSVKSIDINSAKFVQNWSVQSITLNTLKGSGSSIPNSILSIETNVPTEISQFFANLKHDDALGILSGKKIIPIDLILNNKKSFHPSVVIKADSNYKNTELDNLLRNFNLQTTFHLFKTYFFDPYQIDELKSTTIRFKHFGQIELELPAESIHVDKWGSVLTANSFLVNSESENSNSKNMGVNSNRAHKPNQSDISLNDIHFKIPFHSRYRLPEAKADFPENLIGSNNKKGSSYILEDIPIPSIFWYHPSFCKQYYNFLLTVT
ncbi:hypothetical protein AYI70_g401 [Smittium culicis]|uniref:Protein PBN1 n=1 Tax=Smittium culicis TaxID=133412 RepID=A0A1R1YGW7_9FUNG|nr:hypothetical protein AYI70_g401 [Smittium culicis]